VEYFVGRFAKESGKSIRHTRIRRILGSSKVREAFIDAAIDAGFWFEQFLTPG
jgi:hypothetical protein